MRKLPRHSPAPPPAAAGFSLVEIAIALGIAAFGLVAIFGLLPVGINSNHAAAEQTAALNIATGIVSDLRVTTRAAIASPALGIPFPTAPTSSYPTIDNRSPVTFYLDESGGPFPAPQALGGASRYRVTVGFAVPATGQRTATLAKVTLSWPAPALPANASGSVTAFVALDRN